MLWRSVKAVGREALRTGGKILSDLADNSSGDVKLATSSRNMSAIRHKILSRNYEARDVKRSNTKIAWNTLQKEGEEDGRDHKKRHLFIGRIISYPTMATDVVSARTKFDIFFLQGLYRLRLSGR